MNVVHTFIPSFLIVFALISCGGGSSSDSEPPSNTLTGQFIDAPVKGLTYKTESLKEGVTNANGEFTYKAGETVNFFVGDIWLGSAKGSAIVTPLELVINAKDETNATVTNISRLLQTLDDDGNPDNGIVISKAVSDAALDMTLQFSNDTSNFAQDANLITLFSNITQNTGKSLNLVTASQAQAHLKENRLTLYAGTYTGTFSGDDSGTFTFIVATNGTVIGSAISNEDGELTISGEISSNGKSTVSGTAGGSSFEGVFTLAGGVSGTWKNATFNDFGEFSGTRQSSKDSDLNTP